MYRSDFMIMCGEKSYKLFKYMWERENFIPHAVYLSRETEDRYTIHWSLIEGLDEKHHIQKMLKVSDVLNKHQGDDKYAYEFLELNKDGDDVYSVSAWCFINSKMLDLKGTLDSLKEFLLRKLHGEDFQVKTEDGYSVYLFWHAPSTNMGWYPILQIYKSGRSVYFQEGAENPDLWYDLAIDAGTYLCPC